MFLPASDIPSFVGKGNVDLGITGHDVILEAKMESNVTEIQKLGFGKCALQVQVPESGSIKTVDDLAGKRVVTSFEVLAGKYFGEIDERLGIEGENKTKIEYVGGSVEAACALGLADGIGMLLFFSNSLSQFGYPYLSSPQWISSNPETQCALQVCTLSPPSSKPKQSLLNLPPLNIPT